MVHLIRFFHHWYTLLRKEIYPCIIFFLFILVRPVYLLYITKHIIRTPYNLFQAIVFQICSLSRNVQNVKLADS